MSFIETEASYRIEIINGKPVKIITPQTEVTLTNMKTGQEYNSDAEAMQDVQNPETETVADDIKRDVKVTVEALPLGGDTKLQYNRTMAITRAQQYRQMLKDGNVAVQGGVKNYLGKQKTVSDVPVKWQSNPDAPSTELAYITKAEKNLLLKKDIHGSLKDGPNTGPEGIMSLDSQGDKVKDRSGGKKATTPSTASQDNFRQTSLHTYGDTQDASRRESQVRGESKTDLKGGKIGGGGSGGADDPTDQPIKDLQEFYNEPANYSKYTPKFVKYLADLNRIPNRKYFVQKVLRAGKIPGLPSNVLDVYDEDFDIETAYQNYMSNRMAGKTDAMGNPVAGFQYDDSGNLVGDFIDDRGPDQQETDPCKGPNPPAYCFIDPPTDPTDPSTPSTGVFAGIAPRFAGSIFDFDALRAGAMDGGIMNNQVMGGMADGNIDEAGRQMYFLGKLVKKATRAVKKVAKSPIGKAALLYFGAGALGNLAGGSGLGGMFKGAMTPSKFLARSKLSNIFTKGGAKNILFGQAPVGVNKLTSSGILGSGGEFSLGRGITLGFGLPFILDAMGVGKDDDDKMDLDEYYRTQGINIADIRNNPYNYLADRFKVADGGRINYQEGGDAEPVAKKTMPLIDMDGQEKDYRETGGFVDIGRMERADDVPARLSKNEFVFTADAVRNAGEGDIDKGAEVMYNMMKNLEAGGEVSEESQGLEGARKMFQTSKRLEEVL